MVKFKPRAGWLLAILLFALGIYFGLRLALWLGWRRPARELGTPALLLQVQTLSQLVTVKYVMELPVVWEDPPKSLLGQFFAGENRVLLLAHGVVKAGVDLGQLTPADLRVEGTTVVVRLPPGRITDAYLDDNQTRVVDYTTGRFRAFDKDLEQRVRQLAVETIRNAALRGGIVRDADERAQKQLAQLFLELGFKKVEFVPATGLAPTLPDLVPRESGAGTNR